MPCRPSTSTRRVRRPPAASARASAEATVVFPVPPLPVTTCSRAGQRSRTDTSRAYPGRRYVCFTSQTNQPVLLITVRFSFWVAFCTLAVVSVTVVDSTARSLPEDSVVNVLQEYFGSSYCLFCCLTSLILVASFLASRAAEHTSAAACFGSC